MNNLSNCLLIASVDIMDGFFEKKVVYVLDHDDEKGTLGFAINHPLRAIKLKNLLEYLSLDEKDSAADTLDKTLTLFQGGPADIEKAFILRSQGMGHYQDVTSEKIMANQSRQVSTQKLALVESSDELKATLMDNVSQKNIFTLGYAGWSPKQLEKEIELGFWHIAPFDERIVFSGNHENKSDSVWELALNSINIDPNELVDGLGHA